MGKINDFKEFLVEKTEYEYTEEDQEQFKASKENAKMLSDTQRERGGVIGFSSEEAIEYFIELGYEIKKIKHSEVTSDNELMDDIKYRNNVNYVVYYLPEEDDEMELMGEEV